MLIAFQFKMKSCPKLTDVLHLLPHLERMRGERVVNETSQRAT